MKPISIEMKGFSSFKKKTIVNFEPLTQTAIWGIFGKTGSGKSSILDGIFLSLYNKIIRNKLIKEVINLSSKESEVVFNFSVLEYNEVRKFYRIQRNHKIDKDGNLTQTAKMWQVLTDGEEILLANGEEFVTNKAIEIIGLTEEGFRRTVTLHQGEYHQFLKSSPAYQAKIISDLFGLSQYGEKLLTNTVIYKSELEKEESFQRGRLSEYEALTLADIIATKKQATDTAHAAKIKQAEHEIMRVEVLRKEKELIVREEMNEALEARAKMDKSRKDYAKAKKELTTLKVAKKCIPSIERLDIERFTLRENETKLKETDKRLLEVLEKATMLGVKKEQEKTTKMLEIAEKEARKELLLRAVSAEDSILALDKKRKRLEEKKEAQIAKVKKLESVYTINDDEQQKGNEALLKIREAQEKLRVPETILADAKEFDKLSNEISLYAGRGQFLEERLQVVNGKHSTILEKLVADDEKLVVIESEVNNLEERLKEVSGKEAFEESIISANKDHYGLVMGAQNIMFEKARQKEIAKGAAEVETMLRELTEKEKGLTRKFEDYNAAYNNLSERRDKLIEEIFVKARTAGGEASEAVFEVENINARVIELLNLRDKTLAELSGAKISKEHYKLEKTRLTNELIASEKVVSAIEAEHNLLINKDEAQILEVIEASTTFNNELSSIVKTLFRLKEKKLEKEKQCIKNSAELNQIDSQKDFVSTEIEFNQEILKELNKKNEKFAVLFDSVDLKDLISDIETKRRLEEEAKRKEAEIMQILNAVNKEREKSFVAFELAGVDLRHIENQIEVVVDEIKEQRQIVNFSGTRENARTELMEVINTLDALKISVDRINEEDALLIKEETRLKLE
ncbi:MAG: hypothetical protein FWD89_03395, partial [Firmicutes bacterium]|nr:hypothetical protein [Bacillota bacterium]